MLQLIAAIVVAVWFYRSARTVGKNAAAWAVGGAVASFVPGIAVGLIASVAVFPMLMRSDMDSTGFGIVALLISLVGLGLGLALAYWLHREYLRAGPDGVPAADAGTAGPAAPPDNVRNLMQAMFVVALVYAIGIAGLLLWIASMGAGPLPLILFAGIIVLYIMVMRFVSTGNHGKATGFMIAAGIINLPIGIVALVLGIVARRVWKKSLQQQPIAEGQVAPAGNPAAPAK